MNAFEWRRLFGATPARQAVVARDVKKELLCRGREGYFVWAHTHSTAQMATYQKYINGPFEAQFTSTALIFYPTPDIQIDMRWTIFNTYTK